MHVLFICAEYPLRGRPTGGFGTYVDNLTRELIRQKTEVSIICQGEKSETFVEGGRRIRVITPPLYFLIKSLRFSRFVLVRRVASFLRYPFGFSVNAAWNAIKINQMQSIDISEGGDFGAELLFLLLLKQLHLTQFPLVVKLHTPSWLIREYNGEPYSLFYRLIENLERFCLKFADGISSPTKVLADTVGKFIGCNVTSIIPYPAPALAKGMLIKDRNLILFVGKLQTKKGVFVLLSAFKFLKVKLRKAKLLFVGPDTLENDRSVKQQLEEIINEESLTGVTFLPENSQKQIFQWYRTAAVVVVPSLWENYPNVILEALSFGAPVVASRVGGIPEMVGHHNVALLVPPGNTNFLAKALTTMLTDRTLATRLVKAGQRRLKGMAGDVIARRTMLYYQKVIDTYADKK